MASSFQFQVRFRNRRFNDARKGLEAFARQLQKDWDGSAKVMSQELKEFLDSVAHALASRHGMPWPSGTTDKSLSSRTGQLVSSLERSVTVKGQTWRSLKAYITVGFPGVIHEFGATIKAKEAKYLTIPLPPALDERGVPLKKSARDWENTFVARTKAGNLIIFQKRATQIVPLYLLRETTTIPPRLGLRETINTGLPHFVERAMDRMVRHFLTN
jgi:hypothetical protein